MRFSCLVFFASWLLFSSATINLDSMEKAFPAMPDDSIKMVMLRDFSAGFMYSDREKAMKHALLSLKIAEELPSLHGQMTANNFIGAFYALDGRYELSLRRYAKANDLAKMLQDTFKLINTYNNIGEVYRNMNAQERAKKAYRKAIAFSQAINSHEKSVAPYVNLGFILHQQDSAARAFSLLYKALDLASEHKNLEFIASIKNSLGSLYKDDKRYEEALAIFYQSSFLHQKIGNIYGLASDYLEMGTIHRIQKQLDSAYYYALLAKRHAQQAGGWELQIEVARNNAEVYRLLDSLPQAFAQLEEAYALRDSIDRSQIWQFVNQQDVEALEQTNAAKLQQAELEQQVEIARRNYMILAACGLLVWVLLWLVKNRAIRKKEQEQAALKEVALENTRELKRALEKALEGSQQELSTFTLKMLRQNEHLENIKKKTAQMANGAQGKFRAELRDLHKRLDQLQNIEGEWEQFTFYFEQVYSGFFDRLKTTAPDLSPSELRLCALTRLQLNLKETAAILGIEPSSVKTARSRVKKKLQLSSDERLSSYLSDL